MRYILLLLIFGACARHRDKQGSIKDGQDSIRCFGGMAPYGSSILVSDSAYIHRLDKYLNDSTYTFESEDSIVYIFNDSSISNGGHNHRMGDQLNVDNCAFCKIMSNFNDFRTKKKSCKRQSIHDTLYINGEEVMYGENVPLGRIIHDHSDVKACTACKLRNAYINVWKNY